MRIPLGSDRSTRSVAGQGDTYSYVDTIAAGTRQCYEIYDTNSIGVANYSNEKCTSTPVLPAVPTPGVG